jgi:hypothetical protein
MQITPTKPLEKVELGHPDEEWIKGMKTKKMLIKTKDI